MMMEPTSQQSLPVVPGQAGGRSAAEPVGVTRVQQTGDNEWHAKQALVRHAPSQLHGVYIPAVRPLCACLNCSRHAYG